MLLEQIGQIALQRVHHGLQVGTGEAGFHPLLHQQQAHGVGPKDVVAVEFLAFQGLGALAQGVELGADLLGDRQGHARGQDLVFHHVVAEQLELVADNPSGKGPPGADGMGCKGFLPGLGRALGPGGMQLLVLHPRIPARLHFARRARLGHQGGQELLDCLAKLRESGAQALYELLARLAGQATLWNGRGRGLHKQILAGQTVAPAWGSLGSPSFLAGLTRSSRLTPSHMAMAAATNTEE
jgi:hypothetical protein